MIKELIPFAAPVILQAELKQVESDLILLDDTLFWYLENGEQAKVNAAYKRREILTEYRQNLVAEILTRYFNEKGL